MLTKRDVERKTQNLLKLHGMTGWKVTFGTAKARAGVCYPTRKVIRYSTYLMARRSDEGTLDTIKHEVAHAIAGAEEGHGPNWKHIYVSMGGRGEAHWDPQTLVAEREYRWNTVCNGCQQSIGKTFRKPKIVGYHSICCKAGLTLTRLR